MVNTFLIYCCPILDNIRASQTKGGASNKMRHFYFLIRLTAQTKGSHRMIFDNQLTLLQTSYRRLDFLEIFTRHSKEILDDTVRNRLLLHDERILRIGIEIEELTLVTVHVLSGKYDAQALISTHSYQIAKRLIIEVQHIVSLIDNREVANLYIILIHRLLRQLLIDIIELRNDEIVRK